MFWLVYSLYSLWGFVFIFSEIYPTNLALNNGSLFRKTYFANCNSFFATGFNNCCLLAKFSTKANASLLTEPISHWQFSKLIIACTEYLLIIFHLWKELLKWRHADLQTLFFFENVKLLIGKTHLAWKVSRKLFCESTINWLFFHDFAFPFVFHEKYQNLQIWKHSMFVMVFLGCNWQSN